MIEWIPLEMTEIKTTAFQLPMAEEITFGQPFLKQLYITTIPYYYLTIIPWARVGYEMVNSQRGP